MIKNSVLVLTTTAALLFSGSVLADNHTISAGFAESMVKDFKHIKGVNLQYRYEWDSPLSVIGSMTYMSGSDSTTIEEFPITIKGDVKYYSLLVGPAYRFNDYISAYVVGGISHSRNELEISFDSERGSETYNSNNFAYGAGFTINPVKNVAINVGYEGSRTKMDSTKMSVNGFNVGVGYRF